MPCPDLSNTSCNRLPNNPLISPMGATRCLPRQVRNLFISEQAMHPPICQNLRRPPQRRPANKKTSHQCACLSYHCPPRQVRGGRRDLLCVCVGSRAPTEIRTPVLTLKGLRPGPLDDGGVFRAGGFYHCMGRASSNYNREIPTNLRSA